MDTPPIRFRFAADKALAAIHWMVRQRPDVDTHTVLKACYFADVASLNEHGRPVFGATYRAMRYGPVPLEIYEMIKGEPMWLAEMGRERMPWELHGFRLRLRDNAAPDMDDLSPDDVDALHEGFARACGMTFDQRTAATHGPDWQAARLGTMRYEDMLAADHPRRDEILEDLREDGWRFAP